eukprot:CAMPEP_0114563784 /NCGR_PEP_ID=MMETSP0114-20121206/13318_1 /TAXON_ID=31324 /ORGANISM="Goniomonas sp, Strain m" /LENGTH=66 /DNA_ID=CAMNT_0001749701 /DNA_START=28 /DNA_END=224 /DNA_ORIENTATION=-
MNIPPKPRNTEPANERNNSFMKFFLLPWVKKNMVRRASPKNVDRNPNVGKRLGSTGEVTGVSAICR